MTPIQPGLEVLGLAPRFEECISPVPRNDDPLLKMLGGHEPVIGMTPDPFPGDFRFFVRGILQWPQEGVIRSCSSYGLKNECAPSLNLQEPYQIQAGFRYVFENNEKMCYDVFYITHPHRDTMCTWVLRTDGLVMNAESFQPVCRISDLDWV